MEKGGEMEKGEEMGKGGETEKGEEMGRELRVSGVQEGELSPWRLERYSKCTTGKRQYPALYTRSSECISV